MDESTLSIISIDSKESNTIQHAQLRLDIIKAHLSLDDLSPFSDAYVYAWAKSTFPLVHSDAGLHSISQVNWHLPKILVELIRDDLQFAHEQGDPVNIGTIVSNRRHSYCDYTSVVWAEENILGVCRYIFLSNTIHERVWNYMLDHDNGGRASLVCKKFETADLFIC